jgi:hypothetical protein
MLRQSCWMPDPAVMYAKIENREIHMLGPQRRIRSATTVLWSRWAVAILIANSRRWPSDAKQLHVGSALPTGGCMRGLEGEVLRMAIEAVVHTEGAAISRVLGALEAGCAGLGAKALWRWASGGAIKRNQGALARQPSQARREVRDGPA